MVGAVANRWAPSGDQRRTDRVLNRSLLSCGPLVWVGLISYPLYLWHWPLLSFGRIAFGDVPSAHYRVGAIAVSVGLAWVDLSSDRATYTVWPAEHREDRGVGGVMLVVGSSATTPTGAMDWATGISKSTSRQCRFRRRRSRAVDRRSAASPIRRDSVGSHTVNTTRGRRHGSRWWATARRLASMAAWCARRWTLNGGCLSEERAMSGSMVPVLSTADVYLPYQRLVNEAFAAIIANERDRHRRSGHRREIAVQVADRLFDRGVADLGFGRRRVGRPGPRGTPSWSPPGNG